MLNHKVSCWRLGPHGPLGFLEGGSRISGGWGMPMEKEKFSLPPGVLSVLVGLPIVLVWSLLTCDGQLNQG